MQDSKRDVIYNKDTSAALDLNAQILAGVHAEHERVKILKYISELEQSIKNNRQDREDILETEESIRNLEARLEILNKKIESAHIAKNKRLADLKSQKEEIEDRMEFFSRKIDTCTIDMCDNRFSNVESDYESYNEDYSQLYNESRKIAAEIRKLENIK